MGPSGYRNGTGKGDRGPRIDRLSALVSNNTPIATKLVLIPICQFSVSVQPLPMPWLDPFHYVIQFNAHVDSETVIHHPRRHNLLLHGK